MIAGPTGSGKTELAVALARKLSGEIVSADSRQVYRGFDAATSKSRPEGVEQHLIDCASPEEPFDVGRFCREASAAIAAIRARRRRPIVAGGTGLYIKALLEGLSEMPKGEVSQRGRIRERLAKDGEPSLRNYLKEIDPVAESKIPPGNTQRLIRAVEVFELSGKPISSYWGRRSGAVPGPWLCLRIEWSAKELSERLKTRCRLMWPALLEEVARLRTRYSSEAPAFQSLGYREALAVFEGGRDEASGILAFERATLAYAKRQRTWFRHQFPGQSIAGGTLEQMIAEAMSAVQRWDLKEKA